MIYRFISILLFWSKKSKFLSFSLAKFCQNEQFGQKVDVLVSQKILIKKEQIFEEKEQKQFKQEQKQIPYFL